MFAFFQPNNHKINTAAFVMGFIGATSLDFVPYKKMQVGAVGFGLTMLIGRLMEPTSRPGLFFMLGSLMGFFLGKGLSASLSSASVPSYR